MKMLPFLPPELTLDLLQSGFGARSGLLALARCPIRLGISPVLLRRGLRCRRLVSRGGAAPSGEGLVFCRRDWLAVSWRRVFGVDNTGLGRRCLFGPKKNARNRHRRFSASVSDVACSETRLVVANTTAAVTVAAVVVAAAATAAAVDTSCCPLR